MLIPYLFTKRAKGSDSPMTRAVERLFYTPLGQLFISILFGVAVACIFQKACKGNNCIVVHSPPTREIEEAVFENDGECYRYRYVVVACDDEKPDKEVNKH